MYLQVQVQRLNTIHIDKVSHRPTRMIQSTSTCIYSTCTCRLTKKAMPINFLKGIHRLSYVATWVSMVLICSPSARCTSRFRTGKADLETSWRRSFGLGTLLPERYWNCQKSLPSEEVAAGRRFGRDPSPAVAATAIAARASWPSLAEFRLLRHPQSRSWFRATESRAHEKLQG